MSNMKIDGKMFGDGGGSQGSAGGRDTTTDPEPTVSGSPPTDFTTQSAPAQEQGALRNDTTIPAGGAVLHADAPAGDEGIGSTPSSPDKPFKLG